MGCVNVIHIFLCTVSGAPHIANHITCLHDTSHFQGFAVGKILAQMGIIIVPPAVKTADSQTPSAVLVPAHS